MVAQHFYDAAVAATPVSVFAAQGNLYGFYVEGGTAESFLQIFDKASTGDVTLGTTVPAFTFRIPAGGVIGKDVNDSPLHYFARGCVIAVTATRTGAGAPGSPAVIQMWSVPSSY